MFCLEEPAMREISKKDLLRETGISYGQLYRWKREGLIPEDWFVKRSAHTGQETYFPQDQALARVRAILEMKDNRSLEEIRDALSPSRSLRFAGEALIVMTGMAAETFERLPNAGDATLTLEGWALVAAVYEAGVEAGFAYDELVSLTDDAVAWAALVETDAAAVSATETSTTETSTAARPSISQVSVVSAGGVHHFIASTAPTELRGDATLAIRATRQLQVYVDRARAALPSRA
jgi:DNA-binding transcriptional MerR regulator